MTEERIKELIKKWFEEQPITSDGNIGWDVYSLARTVAAEAREEIMEEGYRAGFIDAEAEPDRHLENSLYEWLKENL